MNENKKRLLHYGLIGGTAAGVDFFLFVLAVSYVGIIAANLAATFVGLCVSFFLNRSFNFRVMDRVSVRFVRFTLVSLLGYAIGTLLILVLVSLGVGPGGAKLLSLPAVFLIQFAINSEWTFSQE